METPSALFVAHPGHELFVSEWLRTARPRVLVVTDGSGRLSESRVETTRDLTRDAGCTRGPIFGRFTDKALYDSILEGETATFIAMAREFASLLIEEDIRSVAGDSYERRFLSHDVCRLMIGAAVEKASRRSGRDILNFDFPMYGYFGDREPPGGDRTRFDLSEESFAWKLKWGRTYPDPELQKEIDEMIAERGLDAFKVEFLRRVDNRFGFDVHEASPPDYERHGEGLVAQGHYSRVVRFDPHVGRIATALRDWVEGIPVEPPIDS